MRKIFFFDLDGSMLDTAKGEYALPPKIINCIKLLRSNGNITSVCTARPKQFVKNNLPNIFDCYILLNGSYVEADNKILIDTPFSSEDLANITHRFNSLNISSITTTQIYTHVTSAKQKEIIKTKHPRNNLNIN